jgi:hypothetical protein
MEFDWTINIENNYVRRNKEWNYWQYNLTARGWAVKDHWTEHGQTYYGTGLWPEQKEVQLLAGTKSVAGPKTLEIFIACVSSINGVVKSHRVKFTAKSDGFFSNWYYYCDEQYMADSFFDTKSFEVFLVLKEDGELEIVYKENKK